MTSRPSRPRSRHTFKLAIDARDLARDHRGIGRYARALVRRFARFPDVALTLLVRGVPVLEKARLAKTLGTRGFAVRRAVPANCDVVWHPWNGMFFASEVPAVATIHDVVPFRFPASNPRMRDRQQQPFVRSATTARRIIAVSEFDASELVQTLGIAPDRIEVIYHGVEESFGQGEARPLPVALHAKRYFLFIGDCAEPRKNFELLSSAFRTALPRLPGTMLAVVSKQVPQTPEIVHVPLLNDDIQSHVNVRLRALYRGALAVCVPSYYETFGMPMIESMACGTPVLASRGSCLPEVGGKAALLVEPHDVAAWAAALTEIASNENLQESLSRKGLAQSQRYHWDDCAAQTLSVLKRASHDASTGSA